MGEGKMIDPLRPPERLVSAVEKLWVAGKRLGDEWHESACYKNFVGECADLYGSPTGRHPIRGDFDRSRLASALANAIRLSGAPWFKDQIPAVPEKAARVIHEGFERSHFDVVHLVPLDRAGEVQTLNFGTCSVSRHSAQDLRDIVVPRRLLNHHPSWYFDADRFAHFEWLTVREQMPAGSALSRALPDLDMSDESIYGIEPHATGFPQVVDKALFALTLFPWEEALDARFDWRPFRVPWVYSISSDPFVAPHVPPSPDTLSWSEVALHSGEEVIDAERPEQTDLDTSKLTDLQNYVSEIWSIWSDMECAGHPCSSIVNPLVAHFMVGAFCNEGIFQFLHHMVAIEAALKLDQTDGKDVLGNRVKVLTQRPDSENDYGDLFYLRGDYVHGKRMSTSMTRDHLRRARVLARSVVDCLLRRSRDGVSVSRESFLQQLWTKPAKSPKSFP